MKDAKGHGSNPRGAHSAGVNEIGQTVHGIVPDITHLPAAMLKPMNRMEAAGAEGAPARAGLSKEDWAKQMSFSEAVDVSVFKDGEVLLSDGHHRAYAGKILGLNIPVHVQAINAKPETLAKLRAISDKAREDKVRTMP